MTRLLQGEKEILLMKFHCYLKALEENSQLHFATVRDGDEVVEFWQNAITSSHL